MLRARCVSGPRRAGRPNSSPTRATPGSGRATSSALVAASRKSSTAAAALGLPQLRARAALGIGGGPAAWEVPLGDRHHADLVAAALDALPADAHAMRSMLLARLSVSAATPDTMDLARARAEDALVAGSSASATTCSSASALAAVADALRRTGSHDAPARARRRHRRVGRWPPAIPMLELLGYRFRIVADLEAGDIAAADSGDRGLRPPLRAGSATRSSRWYVPLFRGMRALLAGDLGCGGAASSAVVADGGRRDGQRERRGCWPITLAARASTIAIGGPQPRFDLATASSTSTRPSGRASAAGLADGRPLRAATGNRAGRCSGCTPATGSRRVGDDGEVLVTLLLFGRVAVGLGDLRRRRCRSTGCSLPASRAVVRRRHRGLLLGPRRPRPRPGSRSRSPGRRDDARRHFADARAAVRPGCAAPVAAPPASTRWRAALGDEAR